jgi:beta-glucosidase-like glycosyl hydrolase
LIAPIIEGMQRSIIACVKHFIANKQETTRSPFLQGFISGLINLNNSVSSNLDDRTMHELYLWPFYDAIKAGAGSTMCSYQRVNNSYSVSIVYSSVHPYITDHSPMPKQQNFEWSPEDRVGVRGLCTVRLVCTAYRRG